jgi:hypothetical protein
MPTRFHAESSILFPMFSRLSYAGLAAFLVATGCGSSDSRRADIRFEGKPGDAYSLQISTKTTYEVPGPENSPSTEEQITIDELRSYKCIKTQDGKSTWTVTTDEITASGSGSLASQAHSLMERQRGKSESFTRSSQNKFSDISISSSLDPVYPNRPVGVGDQWRGEVNMQGVKALMTHAFAGFENMNGLEAFLITSTSESPTVNIIKPINLWVERSNGWPIKGEGKFEVISQDGYKAVTVVSLIRK